METQTQPTGYWQVASTPEPTPKKRWYQRKAVLIPTLVLIGVLIGAIGVVIGANLTSSDSSAVNAAADDRSAADAPVATAAPVVTEAPVATLTLADVEVSLITLENQCFGSAGGLVTVEPELALPVGEYPGRATVVYEITGGEHRETYSIELDGSTYDAEQHMIETPTCNSVLSASPIRLIDR